MRALLLIFIASVSWASEVDLLRCAMELNQIETRESTLDVQAGMVIAAGHIIRTKGPSSAVLILLNERGNFLLPLVSGRLNHLQVRLPDPDPRREDRDLYISYSQSEIFGSQLIAMSFDLPPNGYSFRSYSKVEIVRADATYSRWLMMKTIEKEIGRLQDKVQSGRLPRANLLAGNLSLCRGLKSENLNQQIADLEAPLKFSRTPAGIR